MPPRLGGHVPYKKVTDKIKTVIVGDLFFPESVQTGVELVPHLGGHFDAFGLVGFDLRQIGKDNNDIRAEFCPNKTV